MTEDEDHPSGTIYRNQSFALLVVVLTTLTFSCAKTAVSPKEANTFEKLQTENLRKINIALDLDALLSQKEAKNKHKAILTYKDFNNATIQDSILVSVRGKTRRSLCDFPPLKLHFPQKAEDGSTSYSSLKLVTHCQGDEELVLKEYLAYKLFNEISPNSFQVQLCKVQYRNAAGEGAVSEHYAFLIESSKAMARRLDGQRLKLNGETLKTIDSEQYRMLTLFQYMIGNTDWNLGKEHNIKLIKPNDSGAPIAVPYDFDFAGLVNADYASPHPQVPIQNVRERFFQWRGKQTKGLDQTISHFKSKKQALLQLCEQFEYLDKTIKEDVKNYLESFFDIIEDQEQLRKHVLAPVQKRCPIC